jgi:hypothetical protein
MNVNSAAILNTARLLAHFALRDLSKNDEGNLNASYALGDITRLKLEQQIGVLAKVALRARIQEVGLLCAEHALSEAIPIIPTLVHAQDVRNIKQPKVRDRDHHSNVETLNGIPPLITSTTEVVRQHQAPIPLTARTIAKGG